MTMLAAVLPRPKRLLLPPAPEMGVGPARAVAGIWTEIVPSGVVRVSPAGPTTCSTDLGACGMQGGGAGVPVQTPLWQTSDQVQALPSVQAVPFGNTVPVQTPPAQ